MAIYVIGDLHLSFGVKKPMDIFPGWENHARRVEEHWWECVSETDTVVLAGDTSWGMTLEQALADFRFLQGLPGKKLLLKGNHDYWWNSGAKMNRFFADNGLDSLQILHNNSYLAEGKRLCGSRGWLFESGQAHDDKIINREAMRIEASLRAAGGGPEERILFLHYPPLYGEQRLEPFLEVMEQYGIKRCYYGHIHGVGHRSAVQGMVRGITFSMISADYLRFRPYLVEKTPENT